LQKTYADQVVAVTLNVDHDEADKQPSDEIQLAVNKKLSALNMNVENVIAADGLDAVLEKYQAFGVPYVVVYGKDGEIAKKFEGAFSYEEDVNPYVRSLLQESEPEESQTPSQ
jgi:thiol:disulfide interchange protein